MSILFKPMKLGEMEISNRFIRSATYEAMAKENGEISDKLIKLYQTLAKGNIGLIISSLSAVNSIGRSTKYEISLHNDDMIPGMQKLVNAIHQENGKIAFQLYHAGLQTRKDFIGTKPIAPSSKIRNPLTFAKPKEMSEEQIDETIKAFGEATRRVIEAGADAIQIHAAHTYLINQFISPFFNHRKDKWGGSDENLFRFLKEVILEVKKILPKDKALLVKLNTDDHTKREGIKPPLAAKYAKWLTDLGIDALEISCGTSWFNIFTLCRGDVPVSEIVQALPSWKRPLGKMIFKKRKGKFDFIEPYNLEAAKVIKPVIGDLPLILVGGIRKMDQMEDILNNKYADLISMSRPFIREPYLVKSLKEGKKTSSDCLSCNRCIAAIFNDIPVGCYVQGFPKKK